MRRVLKVGQVEHFVSVFIPRSAAGAPAELAAAVQVHVLVGNRTQTDGAGKEILVQLTPPGGSLCTARFAVELGANATGQFGTEEALFFSLNHQSI